MRILIRIAINAIGLYIASLVVPNMSFADSSSITLVIVAAIFGLVNAFIRPIVKLLTLPITVVTLGLFTFVINALMLLIVSFLTDLSFDGNIVQKFIAALIASVIISVVSFVASWFLPDRD